MDALDLLRSLYVYQIWANGELLEKLAGLDQQEHVDQRHTATRLINHNLVVSKIFAAHLSGTRHGYASDNTVDTPALDELSADVAAMDRWYLDYIGAVSPKLMSEPVLSPSPMATGR
ncbi:MULTISPECIES: DinB family protein [unclassified Mesorhizobium]|uniref:DinB family protein n=1 Tax=unclassified Mesorhizobium TaxID=325217 RepID=UPI0003F8309B